MGHCGAIAQLGERFNGIEEVVGSIPSGSTTPLKSFFEKPLENSDAAQDCRTGVSHTCPAEPGLSVSRRCENSHNDCRTSLPHKPVAHRRKRRATGIWLRGTVWQYRVRVPADVREKFGRSWVSVSLKTSVYREAVRLRRLAAFEVEQSLDAARQGRMSDMSMPENGFRGFWVVATDPRPFAK